MKADLHLHTTASDGRLSPEDVVRTAAHLGLAVISITDHDSVDGIAGALKAAGQNPSLTVIPGVEVSTDVPHGEVHVLGYFIDHRDARLAVALAELREARVRRMQLIVSKLVPSGSFSGA